MSKKIQVGIVGGTGYTGLELLKLLASHPSVDIRQITSRSEAGKPIWKVFPNFHGVLDLNFSLPDVDTLCQCDLVFYATPNGVAMSQVPELTERGVKVIDLAADYRLKDPQDWKSWYGMDHTSLDWLEKAVYGLPELNRSHIKEAQLVANPGCYPTSVQIGLLPLLKADVTQSPIIADCKSGVSGAGRGANVNTLLCEASESFSAYGVTGHRHLPEIKQGLKQIAGKDIELTFVPHLTPMIRGIHSTMYVQNDKGLAIEEIQCLYEDCFNSEPFVDVLPQGIFPATSNVKGSNRCQVAVVQSTVKNQLVVLSVIDNLQKGAAGQAVQNMNLMFDLDEQAGLSVVGSMP